MINTEIQLKVTPDFFFHLCQIASDAVASMYYSLEKGGIDVDSAVVSIFEYSKKLQLQYFRWKDRHFGKLYNLKLPLSVAIALLKVLSKPNLQPIEKLIANTLTVRLHDFGFDINTYIPKNLN